MAMEILCDVDQSLAEPNIILSSKVRCRIRNITTTGIDIIMASEPK